MCNSETKNKVLRMAEIAKIVKEFEGFGLQYLFGDRVYIHNELFREAFGTGPDVAREESTLNYIMLAKMFNDVEFRSLFKIPDGVVIIKNDGPEPVKVSSLYDIEL